MSLFIIFFFSVYAGMHIYAFHKAKSAVPFGTKTGICLAIFMLVMIMAPLIIRYLEKAGLETQARISAFTGYTWLGVLFLFCSCAVAIDVYRLLVYCAGFVLHKDISMITPSAKLSFFVPVLLSAAIATYGYFEAGNIKTEKIVIRSSKISKEAGSIRIVQISDVHLGLIVRGKKLKKILQEVKALKPDILVSTGDLVDGQTCNLKDLVTLFQEINPRYGKFAITGNHEVYAGLKDAKCFIEDAGFILLRGESMNIGGLINIAGVDDPAGRNFHISKTISEKELLSTLKKNIFTLLLKHRPIVDKESLGLFDLQLSGHVHKGQIFPFSIITWLYYPVDSGVANLLDSSYLYVNRGSGTWGPPIRFLSSPEVTLIELIHKD
ncbi:MAG: metallophosphoesterase [Nitrospirae bacterium GWC2_42_7]|nr:MAG: metallophosphoesterase [Nitrospirae bacterium GWC2_42_7]